MHKIVRWIKNTARALVFPGVNLHARQRYRLVPRRFEWGTARSDVLDVGCGNGMLSYAAWRRGGRVTGISIKQKEVNGCRAFFNDWKGIPESELRFERRSLAEFDRAGRSYDVVILADVVEHVRDDAGMVATVRALLRPGGELHLTVPHADHPYNASFPLDEAEGGGHVRAGYTEASLRALVEPIGFEVIETFGFGGPLRQGFNRRIKELQARRGTWAGVPLFLLALLLVPFDPSEPKTPYSLYLRCRLRS